MKSCECQQNGKCKSGPYTHEAACEVLPQVTYRASLGKPIVSIVVEWHLLVNLYRISMQEGSDSTLTRHLISMEESPFY